MRLVFINEYKIKGECTEREHECREVSWADILYSSRSKSFISVVCISVFFFVVNVFLETSGKLLSDASIFEVDAFLNTDTFEVDAFEVDVFEVDAFLGTGIFLGAGAGVIFFSIFLKFSF